jgi:hypothetical protein
MDARERADDPRIHLLRKKFSLKMMDCRIKPGNDGDGDAEPISPDCPSKRHDDAVERRVAIEQVHAF